MAKFTDGKGREWWITLTMRNVGEVRDRTGHNLTTLLDDGIKMFAELSTNTLDITNIVTVVIEPQLRQHGVSVESFQDSIFGDAQISMADAFHEAFCDFIPSRQGKILRTVMAEIMTEQANEQDKLLASISGESDSNSLASSESTPGTIPSGNSNGCAVPAET